jgi:tripartite-type tricarboxylate transporter receptor subunit TctC
MAKAFDKAVVIENRSGAGGIIGYEIVARAPPDGYTILIVAGGYTLNPSLYAKLPFDTVRDFEQVLGTTPEEFAAFTKTDIAKWARELKAAGIKPQ